MPHAHAVLTVLSAGMAAFYGLVIAPLLIAHGFALALAVTLVAAVLYAKGGIPFLVDRGQIRLAVILPSVVAITSLTLVR